MIDRQKAIKAINAGKLSDKYPQVPLDFSKIIVGSKSLNDAIMEIGNIKRNNPSLADPEIVFNAISTGNIEKMR